MSWDSQEIDDLIDEVIVDAYGDDEQLSSFECAFEELDVRPDATVVGEVVEVLHIWYDGDERRGLIARCRRNGHEYPLSLLDLASRSRTKSLTWLAGSASIMVRLRAQDRAPSERVAYERRCIDVAQAPDASATASPA